MAPCSECRNAPKGGFTVPDSRIAAYAQLLVERCVNVSAGQQVLVQSSPLARPLVEEVVRFIARRGAYPLVRLNYGSVGAMFASEAPESILSDMAPLELAVAQQVDSFILISAPENTREGAEIPLARRALMANAAKPALARRISLQVPWVGCQYPTHALAQDAGMTLGAYEDFLYGACLLDWDDEGRKMQRIADRFNRADQVRILGEGTDLRLSLKGRHGHVDDGHFNMPGGEVFYSPVEDSVEGVVTYAEFPGVYAGHEVEGARLRFLGGKVVEATARRNESFLLKTLDTDGGARILGELGIGCNPGIQNHMKNVLFDEKIYGTVHLALGAGFPFLGSTNESAVHWDMVKDLRQGGKLFCDGELVQENGKWVF
jgi:aminopeptidase